MFICRLFQRDRPFEQIEARILTEGGTTVGRDPVSDWCVPDPNGVLSRIHLHLEVEAGRLFVSDKSTNGTYLPNGDRASVDKVYEIFKRDSLQIGSLILLIDEVAQVDGGDATVQAPSPVMEPMPPGRMVEENTLGSEGASGDLIEAFCRGAGLDVSALSSEDPRELMNRIGRIYQQTVSGLVSLMGERARLKSQQDLERTTISALDNNPFKWTSSRKIAETLLCGTAAGFLSEAQAIEACFTDLTSHMTAIARSAEAAESMVVRTLSPDNIEAEARSQSNLLRSRQAVCWDIFVRRHAELSSGNRSIGSVRHAFSQAYEDNAAASGS